MREILSQSSRVPTKKTRCQRMRLSKRSERISLLFLKRSIRVTYPWKRLTTMSSISTFILSTKSMILWKRILILKLQVRKKKPSSAMFSRKITSRWWNSLKDFSSILKKAWLQHLCSQNKQRVNTNRSNQRSDYWSNELGYKLKYNLLLSAFL